MSTNRERVRREQEKLVSKEKRSKNTMRWVLGIIVLALIGVLVYVIATNTSEQETFDEGVAPTAFTESGGVGLTSSTVLAEGDGLETVQVEEIPERDSSTPLPDDVSERAEGEKPHVTVYLDPACPHCSTFEQQNSSFLKGLLDDEKITLEHRTVAFMDDGSRGYSSRAGNAMMCAAEYAPENYYDFMSDVMVTGNTQADRGDFLELGAAQGIEDERFENCVIDDTMRASVYYATNVAAADGIPGTPAVYVNEQDVMANQLDFQDTVMEEVTAYEEETA